MKTSYGFAEILEFFEDENLVKNSSFKTEAAPTSSFNAGWETVLDPANLAYLMGHTSIYTSVSSTPYKKFKTIIIRPAHILNEEQAAAFADLSQWAPELNNNFNFKQLKTCYRIALLKTHPDQGGSSENFWSVKKSYEVLCSLVKS